MDMSGVGRAGGQDHVSHTG